MIPGLRFDAGVPRWPDPARFVPTDIDRQFNTGQPYVRSGTGSKTAAPQSAWLLIRGLRTLPLRLQRSFESTKIITAWLAQHPLVDKVIWPFSPNFKQAELAQKQMQGCGGMFSFTLKESSIEKIEVFCNKLQHIMMAVSWGGHESLIIPAIATINKEDYQPGNERHNLIRVYVGLEDAEYLIKDLEQSLP